MLGIIKAYTTRVGSGPFPTETQDESGEHLGRVGVEFGATTGRPRRCGWLDAVAVKKSIINNSISHFCLTKLDVLDGLEKISIAVEYDYNGKIFTSFPSISSDELKRCKPIYREFKGWDQPTSGIRNFQDLPIEAQDYIHAIESILSALTEKTILSLKTYSPDVNQAIAFCNVPRRGLEPPRGFPHWLLRPARLPIPPPRLKKI